MVVDTSAGVAIATRTSWRLLPLSFRSFSRARVPDRDAAWDRVAVEARLLELDAVDLGWQLRFEVARCTGSERRLGTPSWARACPPPTGTPRARTRRAARHPASRWRRGRCRAPGLPTRRRLRAAGSWPARLRAVFDRSSWVILSGDSGADRRPTIVDASPAHRPPTPGIVRRPPRETCAGPAAGWTRPRPGIIHSACRVHRIYAVRMESRRDHGLARKGTRHDGRDGEHGGDHRPRAPTRRRSSTSATRRSASAPTGSPPSAGAPRSGRTCPTRSGMTGAGSYPSDSTRSRTWSRSST